VLRTNLWLVPAIEVLAAVVLFAGTYALDLAELEYTIAAVTCVFSERRPVCQAAIWYSCVSPPGTCLRRIGCSARLIGSGGRVSA
jgi:hypothetical protein